MPIVDIEIVGPAAGSAALVSARTLADALGQALASPPGNTWVRLRALDAAAYAENGVAELDATDLPVFVTLLHAHPPAGPALAAEVTAVTAAVARCLACSTDRVHVQYAPAAAGRQAFGGRLVE